MKYLAGQSAFGKYQYGKNRGTPPVFFAKSAQSIAKKEDGLTLSAKECVRA